MKELEDQYAEMEKEEEKYEYDPNFEAKMDRLKEEIAEEERKQREAEAEMTRRREEASKEYEDAKAKFAKDKEKWEAERKE